MVGRRRIRISLRSRWPLGKAQLASVDEQISDDRQLVPRRNRRSTLCRPAQLLEGWSKDGEELLFASHEPAASMQKGQANADNADDHNSDGTEPSPPKIMVAMLLSEPLSFSFHHPTNEKLLSHCLRQRGDRRTLPLRECVRTRLAMLLPPLPEPSSRSYFQSHLTIPRLEGTRAGWRPGFLS
jgi:hypothetical protein